MPCYGFFKTPTSPSELATIQDTWQSAGTITVANAALGVDGRSASDVAAIATANKVLYTMSPWGNALEVRFQTKADGDSHIVNHYVSRGGSDHYDLATVLTLTGGKQEADGSYFFVDTITATETFTKSGIIVHSAADGIARYVVDACGYSNHLFIATTLQGATTLTPQFSTY